MKIEPDAEVMWIPGRPNFWRGSYACYMRRMGHDIRDDAEAE